jgi:hypothetical protein
MRKKYVETREEERKKKKEKREKKKEKGVHTNSIS